MKVNNFCPWLYVSPSQIQWNSFKSGHPYPSFQFSSLFVFPKFLAFSDVFYFRMIGLTVIFFLGMTLFHFTEYADFWHFLTKVSNTNACLYQYFILNTLSLMSLETLKKYGTFEIEYDPFLRPLYSLYADFYNSLQSGVSDFVRKLQKACKTIRNHLKTCYNN